MKLQALPSAGIGFTSVVFIGAFRGAGFAFICIPGIGFAFAAIGFACGFMLCFGRFVSFQIYIGVKRNETVGSGMCGKGMWISAFYNWLLCKVKATFA